MSPGPYPTTPEVAVGGVVIHRNRILLVQRGTPPAIGEWAIPGGRVELGETLQAAVEREIMEETGVRVQAGKMMHLFESIHEDPNGGIRFHYIIVDFQADYVAGNPAPRDDATDARWVSPQDAEKISINSSTLDLLKKIGFVTGADPPNSAGRVKRPSR